MGFHQRCSWKYVIRILRDIQKRLIAFIPGRLRPTGERVCLYYLPVCLPITYTPLRVWRLFYLIPGYLPSGQFIVLLPGPRP